MAPACGLAHQARSDVNTSSDLPLVPITGTSSGIGKSLAALLAQSGWRVVATIQAFTGSWTPSEAT